MFTTTQYDDFQLSSNTSTFVPDGSQEKADYVIIQDGADTGLVKSSSLEQVDDTAFLSMLLEDKSNFLVFDPMSIPVANTPIEIERPSPPVVVPSPVVTLPMPELGSDVLDPFAEYAPPPPLTQFFPVVPTQQIQFSPQPEFGMPDISMCVNLPINVNMGLAQHMIPALAAQVPHMTVNPSLSVPVSLPPRRTQKRKGARSELDSGDEQADENPPLTADVKKQRRLEKNREAAQQFRQRQKTYTMELNNQVASLSDVNKDLQEKMAFLVGENNFLKEQLTYMRHFVNQAMTFKGPDSDSNLLSIEAPGIAAQ